MIGYAEPCHGQIRSFIVYAGPGGNTNLTSYVHCIRVYETVCKPYLTAQVIIYDNNNIIETLGIQAMTQCSLSFWAPPNENVIYDCHGNMSVLKLKGEQVPDTLKFQIYYIDLVGQTYYQDRASTVQKNFGTTNGTDAISQIWSQYLGSDGLNIKTAATSMLGSDNQSHTSSEKPFTSIYSIMKTMLGKYQDTGSWLLYRDNKGVNIQQLQDMTTQAAATAQEKYIQRETWGITFNDPDIYRAIIVAQAEAGRGDGGRSSGADTAAASNQTQSIFDYAKGVITKNGTNIVSSGLIPGLTSINGGKLNNQIIDSSKIAAAQSFANKTIGENSFSAKVRNGPQITVKVPLQTGLNATVGQGIELSLLPPIFQPLPGSLPYPLDGNWLVTDLCHEIYSDQRDCQASTSMQCVFPFTS